VLDFPANPTSGDLYGSWIWDGEKWISTNAPAAVVASDTPPANPKPGDLWFDTVGLALYVRYDDGTSEQWVVTINQPTLPDAKSDGSAYGRRDGAWVNVTNIARNCVGNPDIAINQWTTGQLTAQGYIVDRWWFGGTPANAGFARQAGADEIDIRDTGCLHSLQWSTTTATAVGATDTLEFFTGIEGCDFNVANFGTASAQPVTLVFTVYTTLAGTYAGALQRGAQDRSYVFTFDLVAGAWQKIRITIPGDTVGAWAVADNALAACLVFSLGTGSTYVTAPDVWVDGYFQSAPGALNPVEMANANIWFTRVGLVVGEAAVNAEPEIKSFADNLADCQRYFRTSYTYGVAPGTASQDASALQVYTGVSANNNWCGLTATFPSMRIRPTFTLYDPHTGAVGSCWEQNTGVSLQAGVWSASTTSVSMGVQGVAVAAGDMIKFHYAAFADF
jgi:hypothetical protein